MATGAHQTKPPLLRLLRLFAENFRDCPSGKIHPNVTQLPPKSRIIRISFASMQDREDFQTLFCKHYAVKPDDYATKVLKLTVYPHARWAIWVCVALDPHYLEADYDFIDSVSRIRRMRDFQQTVEEFYEHPLNKKNLFRHWFLIRVSSDRLYDLAREVLKTQSDRARVSSPQKTADANAISESQ